MKDRKIAGEPVTAVVFPCHLKIDGLLTKELGKCIILKIIS